MTPYLLFSLNGAHYGVEAQVVQEITWLPELAPIEQAPHYMAGQLNLRGKIAPVMDLGLRLGHPARHYQLSDCIVMLHADSVTMGMIVSNVSDVVWISASQIESRPLYDSETPDGFLVENAKLGEEIVMLLDVPRLIHAQAMPGAPEYPKFSADAAERATFRSRAHNLMQTVGSLETAEKIPLSIVQLGEECFGVGLDVVREFSHLRRVTSIPCCPPHIAGNMNLRGDILTLVDIRGLLSIHAGSTADEVMVIESGELSVGVLVDKVLEVIYLRPADIASLHATAHEARNEYCKGVARYGEGMAGILDMQKILAHGGLEVEEEV